MPTAQSATPRRKRCLNCNKFFVPKRNVVKKAKYCSDRCRKEFWTHGSAFGPMKLGLYAAIDKKYKVLFREMTQRFIDERKRIGLGFADLERKLKAVQDDAGNLRRILGLSPTVEEAQPDKRSQAR